MSVKPVNRPIDERSETPSNGQVDGQKTTDVPASQDVNPTFLQLFQARFKRNKPGYQFLADH